MKHVENLALILGDIALQLVVDIDESFSKTKAFESSDKGQDFVFIVGDLVLIPASECSIVLAQAEDLGNAMCFLGDLSDAVCNPHSLPRELEDHVGQIARLHETLFDRSIDVGISEDESALLESLRKFLVVETNDSWLNVYQSARQVFAEIAFRDNDGSLNTATSILTSVNQVAHEIESIRQKVTSVIQQVH